jgi:hypothetical protein
MRTTRSTSRISGSDRWPIFADEVIALTGAPVMMIMTAQGATGLVYPDHWRPAGIASIAP